MEKINFVLLPIHAKFTYQIMLVTPILADRIRGLQEARKLVSRINRKETQLVGEILLEKKSGFKSPSGDIQNLRNSLIKDYNTLINDHSRRTLPDDDSESEETELLTPEDLDTAVSYFSTLSRAFIYLGRYNRLDCSLNANEAILSGYEHSVVATVFANDLKQMANDEQAI